MAKQCCVCGKSIGFMDSSIELDSANHYACSKCHDIIEDYRARIWNTESIEQIEEIRKQADEAINSKASELTNPQILRDYLYHNADKKISFIREREQKAQQKTEVQDSFTPDEGDTYEFLRSKLILSTAGMLEGYSIQKQLGIVFGETVFKPSAGQQISSALSDTFRAFSFSAKEMKGQVSIIEEARKFAYVKMMKAALDLGANAIIAIDSDNTIGDSICYLPLYGTAVYVEPKT